VQTICIIGAGLWQKPYLSRARELGYRVIACDWSEKAAGREYADVFEPIDVKDKEGVLNFAQRHSAEAVLTAADVGVPTAAFVARKLNFPYHTEILAYQATNKAAMRKTALEQGIPIPEFRVVGKEDDVLKPALDLHFPLICKPSDNCSSRGVTVVNNEHELIDASSLARQNTSDGNILLEEFMQGTEGSVEAICSNRQITILGICSKIKSPLPYRYDLQLNYPGHFNSQEVASAETLLRNVVRGFNIIDGIIHLEFIIKNENAKLIEFALRGCGSNVITHLIPALTGFDAVAYLVHQAFGRRQIIELNYQKKAVLKFVILPVGKIRSINGVDDILKRSSVVDFLIEKKPGDYVQSARDGRSRPGYFIAVADTLEQLANEAEYINNTLKVEYENP